MYLYGPDCGPIETTFESAGERLQKLARLYFELDGSFVWKPTRDEEVFGMLYDAANQLQYVELRGTCSLESWRVLMESLRGDIQHGLAVMILPERQLQNLQDFETSFKDA